MLMFVCVCADGWVVDIVHIIIIKKIRGRGFESKGEVGRRREGCPGEFVANLTCARVS